MTSLDAALRWYLVLLAVTWAFAPLVRWLCRGLPDRGATIARPLAMLGVIWPGWLLASLGIAPFNAPVLVATALVAGVIGWALMVRGEGLDRGWLKRLVTVEGASLAAFVGYLLLRGFTPEILGTEKPMDVAFLASSTRTIVMPPPDPWFAGQPINYYYLGYLLHGAISRLAGVPPQFAFNLALAAIFATTIVAAFGAAWNVLGSSGRFGARAVAVGGLLGAFLVAIAGNLYAPWRLLTDARATWEAWWWDSAAGIGWRASRIVCDGPRQGNLCEFPSIATINEFPFFSFLLGDLHPHLMALPLTLVMLGLTWNLATLRNDSADDGSIAWWARVALTGLVAGALYPLNAWDFPTYLAIALGGVWAGTRGQKELLWRSAGLLMASSLLAWLPFWARYDPPVRTTGLELLDRLPVLPGLIATLGLHTGERTSLGEYLTIFGVPYLIGVLLLLVGGPNEQRDESDAAWRVLAIAAVVTVIPGVLLAAPVLPLCGIPLALALHQLRQLNPLTSRAVALALFAAAWLLSIGVEIVYLRDAFDNRMNTLFKFYYQTWTLAAIAAAIAIPLIWTALPWRSWPRAALAGLTALTVIVGLAYPVVASYQWTSGFTGWKGLDGLAYAEAESQDDVAAIRWLQDAAMPGDVVLEAAGCSYRPSGRLPFNRVAAFTGVPSVIGWGDNHQRQWRAGQPDLVAEIRGREEDVAAIYADPASGAVEEYGITWLFAGDYEQGDWRGECQTAGPYAGIAAAGFPGPGWEEAFRSGDTRVYRRVR